MPVQATYQVQGKPMCYNTEYSPIVAAGKPRRFVYTTTKYIQAYPAWGRGIRWRKFCCPPKAGPSSPTPSARVQQVQQNRSTWGSKLMMKRLWKPWWCGIIGRVESVCCSRQAVDRRRVLGARCVEPFCCVCSWGRGVQGKLEGRTRTHLNISMTRGNLPPRKPILRDISMGGVRQFPGETVSFPPRHTTRYCTQAKKTERSSHHGGEDGR